MEAMTDPSYEPFVLNLVRILEKNGYPDKRVALPLERLYEAAYEKQLNFNNALTILAERGIAHEKTNTRVVFFPHVAASVVAEATANPFAAFSGLDAEQLQGANLQELLARAQEMLQSMPPEQVRQFQELYAGMSQTEREEMMRKAKDMGLA